jgi:hypothetical protein
LKAERSTTNAAVPTVTPSTEMPEMMLITLVLFFEKRYLNAMKSGNFNA